MRKEKKSVAKEGDAVWSDVEFIDPELDLMYSRTSQHIDETMLKQGSKFKKIYYNLGPEDAIELAAAIQRYLDGMGSDQNIMNSNTESGNGIQITLNPVPLNTCNP